MRLFVLVLIPVQAVALWVTMIRFQHGFGSRHPNLFNLFTQTASINPFSGAWRPPAGAILPVTLCAAGTILLITVCERISRIHRVVPECGGSAR
jgi:hypothetical protein